MTKINKGACYVEPIPFDGEDQKREVKKTKNDKGVDYVQAGIAELIEKSADGWIEITPY